MSPRYVIRRAEPGDCEELTTVAHAAKRHWGYPEDHIGLWRDDLTVTPEMVLGHPVYVAMDAFGADPLPLSAAPR